MFKIFILITLLIVEIAYLRNHYIDREGAHDQLKKLWESKMYCCGIRLVIYIPSFVRTDRERVRELLSSFAD